MRDGEDNNCYKRFPQRDLILVAGRNCVGKSTAIGQIKETLRQKGVDCDEVPFSLYKTLLNKTIEDDGTGGKNHFHPVPGKPEPTLEEVLKGHTHINGNPPTEPFTTVGKTLDDKMLFDLFQSLSNLPYIKV